MSNQLAYAVCSTCHGADGNGIEYVAPNIRAYDDALVMTVLKMVKRCNQLCQVLMVDLTKLKRKALAAY